MPDRQQGRRRGCKIRAPRAIGAGRLVQRGLMAPCDQLGVFHRVPQASPASARIHIRAWPGVYGWQAPSSGLSVGARHAVPKAPSSGLTQTAGASSNQISPQRFFLPTHLGHFLSPRRPANVRRCAGWTPV